MKTLIFLLSAFIFFSCEETNSVGDSRLRSVSGEPLGVESDAYRLEDAYITGEKLFIEVGYSGGCKEHEFTLIWPEVITMIYPPQFSVSLSHDGNGDLCEAFLRDTLEFDLTKNPLGISVKKKKKGEVTLINASQEDEQIILKEK